MKKTSSYPTISVIIPVYNVQDYVIRCLKSIVAQTCPGDMECILVDDYSTDQSVQLIEQFISSYHGRVEFRLIRLDHNQGQSAARNVGFKASKGELFAFVDSDDWIEPNMYEELYQYLSIDHNALFVTSAIIAELPQGSEYGHANTDTYEEGGIMEPYHFLKLLLSTKTNGSPCNKLYRREFFTIPFREGMVSEDYLFFYDNSKAQIGKDVHFITTPKSYYHYIIHSGSTMNQDFQSPKQWYIDFLVGMTYVLDDCENTYPELYDVQLKRFTSVYGYYFYEIVNNRVLTRLRKEALYKLNKYVRVIDKRRFSLMTRTDMFLVSYFPNGYCLVRYISNCRKNIKSILSC